MTDGTAFTRLSSPVYMQAVYELGDLTFEQGHSLTTHPRLRQMAPAFEHLSRLVQYAELVVPPLTREIAGFEARPSWTGIPAGLHMRRYTLSADDSVRVTSVHMSSPLEVVLEIPPPLWLAAGFGLVALAERVSTAPVRIARKRKEEILKSIELDREIESIAQARADTFAEALEGLRIKDDTKPPNIWFGMDDATEDLTEGPTS